jgi:hypothetical protein
MTNRKPKPKLRKGETVWWTIAVDGYPIAPYAAATRKAAIRAFNENIIQPNDGSPLQTIKDYRHYKPVKIIVRLA